MAQICLRFEYFKSSHKVQIFIAHFIIAQHKWLVCLLFSVGVLLGVFTGVKCSSLSNGHQLVDIVFVIEMPKSWSLSIWCQIDVCCPLDNILYKGVKRVRIPNQLWCHFYINRLLDRSLATHHCRRKPTF